MDSPILSPNLPNTLLERLSLWGERQPQSPALVYLVDGDREQQRLDYGTLLECVENSTAWLRDRVRTGERALLVSHSEIHYLIGLLACLRAGVVAVPSLTTVNPRALERIQAHGEDAQARVLLADAWVLARRERYPGEARAWINSIPWLSLEEACVTGAAQPAADKRTVSVEEPTVHLAYLQYTSGSTSLPKGVMVTHANLTSQLGDLERLLGHGPGSVICNWMPLYHDFGLVMSLQALYCGGTAVLMPAAPTVQRPRRWLQAISDYRAHTSAAPNFMFDRCVEKIPLAERHGLDLSSLRHVLNGAEPIQPSTLRAFREQFRPHGFRDSAWVPAYGLAEATLVVSMEASEDDVRLATFDADALREHRAVAAPGGKELAGCGYALVEASIRIVDPESGQSSPPGSIGEVWVSSPSVAAGYWQRESESAETFGARIRNADDDRRHLRTGDLGFLWEGELFIAGRLKDLVIVRGENHYPQDIEYTVARSHQDLEPNAGASFAIERAGGELLVIVQEFRREAYQRSVADDVFAAVRHAVAEDHGLDVAHIVLLRPGGLPRTSSGKVQRRACLQSWQEGRLPVLAEWDASRPLPSGLESQADALELEIIATCKRLLGTDRIDPQVSLFTYGVDSLKAVEILLALEERWKVYLDLADFAERSTVSLLARTIRENSERPPRASRDQQFFLGDRDEDAPADADGLIAKLRPYVSAWEGSRASPDSLLVGRNVDGRNPPLYWIFQGQQEFAALAERLGPDQPVFGMRSGHQVMEYTESNVQAMATRYRREISAVQPDGPYLLGGNCQGGLIALAIAQQYWRLQRPVALLALLEWAFPPQPYMGSVALFWGESSWQKNPYSRFRNPELYWRRAFASYTVDIVSGGHGEFFSGRNLDVFAERLLARLQEAVVEPPLLLPAAAQRANYHVIDPPTQLNPGQSLRLEVEVSNTGTTGWAATERSGLQLGNHWLDQERQVVDWLDGVVSLPAVRAGGTARVELSIRAPSLPGNYFLQLDLVEEAVAWFSEKGAQSLIVPVTVMGKWERGTQP